jgi:hypothetical protein
MQCKNCKLDLIVTQSPMEATKKYILDKKLFFIKIPFQAHTGVDFNLD